MSDNVTELRPGDGDETLEEMERRLAVLREPFPADMIEKLPKPTFKDAWRDQQGSKCDECHGFHPARNTIHLSYCGHASVTNRLLDADPFWSWEPMALTPDGLPRFDNSGGLWIRLTVCGVNRLGYGDGKSVKEVIGDAIRNAAMRFGVALDLWSKIDLHAERNPGAGEQSRPVQQPRPPRANGRAANQDALDSLLSVCQEYDLLPRDVVARFEREHPGVALTRADPEAIMAYAAMLIEEGVARDASEATSAGGHLTEDAAIDEAMDRQASEEVMF